MCSPSLSGTSVYSFEGIGLVLPIESEMKERQHFRFVLISTMSFIMLLFIALGEIPVLAFGQIENGSMTAVLQTYFPGWPVSLVLHNLNISLAKSNRIN